MRQLWIELSALSYAPWDIKVEDWADLVIKILMKYEIVLTQTTNPGLFEQLQFCSFAMRCSLFPAITRIIAKAGANLPTKNREKNETQNATKWRECHATCKQTQSILLHELIVTCIFTYMRGSNFRDNRTIHLSIALWCVFRAHRTWCLWSMGPPCPRIKTPPPWNKPLSLGRVNLSTNQIYLIFETVNLKSNEITLNVKFSQ